MGRRSLIRSHPKKMGLYEYEGMHAWDRHLAVPVPLLSTAGSFSSSGRQMLVPLPKYSSYN